MDRYSFPVGFFTPLLHVNETSNSMRYQRRPLPSARDRASHSWGDEAGCGDLKPGSPAAAVQVPGYSDTLRWQLQTTFPDNRWFLPNCRWRSNCLDVVEAGHSLSLGAQSPAMSNQNASVTEGPAPAYPTPAETSDGSVQASQHTLNQQLPAETSSKAARVDGTCQTNAKLVSFLMGLCWSATASCIIISPFCSHCFVSMLRGPLRSLQMASI